MTNTEGTCPTCGMPVITVDGITSHFKPLSEEQEQIVRAVLKLDKAALSRIPGAIQAIMDAGFDSPTPDKPTPDKPCPTCYGTTRYGPNGSLPCPTCHGSGKGE